MTARTHAARRPARPTARAVLTGMIGVMLALALGACGTSGTPDLDVGTV